MLHVQERTHCFKVFSIQIKTKDNDNSCKNLHIYPMSSMIFNKLFRDYDELPVSQSSFRLTDGRVFPL